MKNSSQKILKYFRQGAVFGFAALAAAAQCSGWQGEGIFAFLSDETGEVQLPMDERCECWVLYDGSRCCSVG